MAETRSTGEGKNLEVDYEHSDVRIPIVFWFGLGIIIWLALVPLILSFGYPQAMTDSFKRTTVRPPGPRLQVDPEADLATFRLKEEAWLHSYGWIDRQKGIVHIPIDAAMAKLAHDGIPGWPAQ